MSEHRCVKLTISGLITRYEIFIGHRYGLLSLELRGKNHLGLPLLVLIRGNGGWEHGDRRET